jgi:DNA uptake protein ComE-like DNA-binding protein
MKLNTGPFRAWLGHTRGERRATIALLIVIFIITLIRYGFPSRHMVIDRVDFISYGKHGQVPDSGMDQETAEFMPEPVSEPFPDKFYEIVQPSDTGSSRELQKAVTESGQTCGKKVLIDINSCDSMDLVALRGIGPVLSVRIIRYRKLLGGYASVEQLREVYGLPEETFLEIRDKIRADTTLVRKININTTGYRDLCRIPYLEKYDVASILKYRELKGSIKSVEELVSGKIIDAEKAVRASPYMIFDP